MRFSFIDLHCDRWPVAVMCRILNVARAGYYAWRGRPVSPRAKRRVELAEQIVPIFTGDLFAAQELLRRSLCPAPPIHATIIRSRRTD